jgi:hypothetical protein
MKPSSSALEFHRLLLAAIVAVAAVYLFRYSYLITDGKAVFAEDFSVFRQALHIFDSWPPASPYHAEGDAGYFAGQGTLYHPYLNAPFFLLLLWPLKFLPREGAVLVFFAVQLTLWFLVLASRPVRALWPQLAQRHYALTCVIVSLPFVINTMLSGQAGIFYASLLLLGCSLLEEKPRCGGSILALLLCKPTLVPLVLLLLLVRKNLGALYAFIVTGLLFTATSTVIWGAPIWQQWVAALSLHTHMMQLPQLPAAFARQLISIYAGARIEGLSLDTSFALQFMAGAMAVLAVIYTARRDPRHPLALAVFFTSVFLFGAYVLQYDAMILAAPLLILLDKNYTEPLPRLTRVIIICSAFSGVLAANIQAMGIPYGALSVLFLWWACVNCFLRLHMNKVP